MAIITCRGPCVNIVVTIQFERLGLMYNTCRCTMNLITHRIGTVSVVRDWFVSFPSSPVLISAGVSSSVTALLLYTCTHRPSNRNNLPYRLHRRMTNKSIHPSASIFTNTYRSIQCLPVPPWPALEGTTTVAPTLSFPSPH